MPRIKIIHSTPIRGRMRFAGEVADVTPEEADILTGQGAAELAPGPAAPRKTAPRKRAGS
jgi:hypothetical protein